MWTPRYGAFGPIWMLLLAASARAADAEATVQSPWKSFFDTLPGLLWVILALVSFLYFHKELKNLLRNLVLRANSGAALKLGPVEFAAMTFIPPIPRKGGPSPGWKKASLDDGSLLAMWKRYPEYSNYAMLVHKFFPSSEPGQVYDVLLYLVERQDGALLSVSKVEYYFGPFWKNYIYPSSDRSRGFPIRVAAYDRFICIARIHFIHTPETAIVFRYVDFEMGIYPTIPKDPSLKPAEPAEPAEPPLCGGQPIEIIVGEKPAP